ncbi:SCO family protein [Ruegeria faecimaris]|uniref:SCO family protein n=1 Tax=Ruegeria faecimaris TaxID=686389 RepID=UPI00232C82D6|nr:SCO family protein [Ruegeria faecimaris]
MAGVATAAFAYLMLWSEYRPARIEEGSVPFEARFELTDHSGVVRTQNDFAGKWMLVFFGFTNCPDVCPTTLSEVAAVQEGLGNQSIQVQPIFISIDPERDTPGVLAEYVPLFDAGIIGLTGTPEQIEETSKTFPIFYERIEQATAPDGYTMGHTSHLFLFNKDAGFVQSWSYGTPAEGILADLKQRL